VKPLSETHPTLYNEAKSHGTTITAQWFIDDIQSCTVDREEHEAVLKRKLYYKEHMEAEQRARIDEVERLKKELANVQAERDEIAMVVGEEQFALGEVEGERRAKERVKEAINKAFFKWANDNSVGFALEDIEKELGLGEEEQR